MSAIVRRLARREFVDPLDPRPWSYGIRLRRGFGYGSQVGEERRAARSLRGGAFPALLTGAAAVLGCVSVGLLEVRQESVSECIDVAMKLSVLLHPRTGLRRRRPPGPRPGPGRLAAALHA